jgi:hypothetical protein
MSRVFAVPILLLISTAANASGPYSPVRVDPRRDEVYNVGRAIFVGDVKLGSGTSCASCHAKKEPLNRARLEKVKFSLETHISNCVQVPDRVNGSIESTQMEALVRYLAKRYGL